MNHTVVIQVYRIDNDFFPFTEGSVLKAENCNCQLLLMPLSYLGCGKMCVIDVFFFTHVIVLSPEWFNYSCLVGKVLED